MTNEPKKNQFEKLLKIQDVVGILNVGPNTIYRLIQDGKLTSIRIRNALRFRRTDVERLITESVSAES